MITAHQYYESLRTHPEKEKLVLFGKGLLRRYKHELENGSKEQCFLYYTRLRAIVQTLQNPGQITTHTYGLKRRKKFSGNAIQHSLYGEIVGVVNENLELQHAFSDIEYVTDLTWVVSCATDLSSICNCTKEYEEGYSLVDFARDVLHVGKRAGMFILQGAAGVAAGAWNMATFPFYLTAGIATAPVSTTTDIVCGLGGLVWSLLKGVWDVTTKFGDEFAKTETATKLREFREYLSSASTEELVFKISKFATELMFPIACSKLRLANKYKRLVGNVSKGVSRELSLPQARKLLVNELKAVLEVKQFIAESRYWTKDAVKHQFVGRIDFLTSKLCSGLHQKTKIIELSKKLGLEMKDLTFEKLSNGVIRAHLPKEIFASKNFWKRALAMDLNGSIIRGAKTCWPEDWGAVDILKAGEEFFENKENFVRVTERIVKNLENGGIKKEKIFHYKGRISSGLNLKGYLNEQGKVLSVFPAWVQ